jgi:hypothetical protein
MNFTSRRIITSNTDSRGRTESEGYRLGNMLASYVHLRFRAEPTIARSLVEAAIASRTSNLVPDDAAQCKGSDRIHPRD